MALLVGDRTFDHIHINQTTAMTHSGRMRLDKYIRFYTQEWWGRRANVPNCGPIPSPEYARSLLSSACNPTIRFALPQPGSATAHTN